MTIALVVSPVKAKLPRGLGSAKRLFCRRLKSPPKVRLCRPRTQMMLSPMELVWLRVSEELPSESPA